jgi:hypothetical protein
VVAAAVGAVVPAGEVAAACERVYPAPHGVHERVRRPACLFACLFAVSPGLPDHLYRRPTRRIGRQPKVWGSPATCSVCHYDLSGLILRRALLKR